MSLNPLNKFPLNNNALNSDGEEESPQIHNGALNSFVLNGLVLNGSPESSEEPIEIPSFNAISVVQVVGIAVVTNNAIIIEQDVQFRNTFAGIIVDIEQNIENIFNGQIISVEQNVLDKTANTFFNRNGWVVDLTIDGYLIPHDRIFKDIVITKEENQSNQCTFALLVADPVAFIDDVWGKSITVDYTTSTGTKRVFTGVVAIPEIDVINRNVRFTCSNNRDEIINNTLASFTKTVGRYSQVVQGKADTTADEMNFRMQTIPYSLDFDGANVYHLNSWYAKNVPDYTLTDADIYYREPKVVWQDRTKIKNSYTLSVAYQYTRLYHYQRPFVWDFPFEFCQFLEWQYSMPNISMIEDAITNAHWVPTAPIIFTSVFPPGHCTFGSQLVLWNTSSLANFGTYSTIFDSTGAVISDPDGNNVYGFKPFTDQTDLSSIYTIGASWTGSTRFSQYIEEDYNMKVYSTQSINQFGEITDANSVNIKDDFDASSWENYTAFTPQPAGAISFGGGSYYFNEDTNPNVMQQAVLTEIDMAKTDILSTHRNTQVIVDTPLQPDFELSHTIAVSTEKITAKGKAQRIVHTLSVSEGKGSTTNVTIALFRSKGSASSTPTHMPARPSDGIALPSYPVVLGSHYGITDPSFNGHIGNKNNPRVAGTLVRTNVQEEFRVDTPAIPDAYRKLRKLPVSSNFEVAIPNDLLDISL